MRFLGTKPEHKPDYLIIFCVGFLVVFGLVMLASASADVGQRDFGDPYYYLKHQIMLGLLLGIAGYWLGSKVYYGAYRNRSISTLFLILSIALLVMVFTPLGITAKGATRWLDIAGFSFQPSELLKITLVIYFATWLSRSDFRQKAFLAGYIPFLIIIGVISTILLAQHSTSPVVILVAVSLIMYFISGAKWRYVLGTIITGVIALAIIVMATPYRAQRVLSFLEPEADPRGSGYHLLQAQTAIGSGKLTGVGYGQSLMKNRLPEPIGDSIFAIIAEEWGFLGAMVTLGIFTLLVLRIFMLAKKARDKFAQLLLVGFGSIIGIQTLINIGAMSGVLPLTGTPLPFISYGGTALMVFLAMAGIIVNISKYN